MLVCFRIIYAIIYKQYMYLNMYMAVADMDSKV